MTTSPPPSGPISASAGESGMGYAAGKKKIWIKKGPIEAEI